MGEVGRIPDLSGMSWRDAETVARAAGCAVRSHQLEPSDAPVVFGVPLDLGGFVVSQLPAPGSPRATGQLVTLWLGRGEGVEPRET